MNTRHPKAKAALWIIGALVLANEIRGVLVVAGVVSAWMGMK